MENDDLNALNTRALFDGNEDIDIGARISQLFNQTQYAVVCTSSQQYCHGALVAFAYSNNLKKIYFATPKATRKYAHILDNANIAMVFDNRRLLNDDIGNIEAVTAKGEAQCVEKPSRIGVNKLLVQKHAYMKNFFHSESVSIIELQVHEYFYVTHFQELFRWIPN